ncbi:hypothetical protein B7H23_06790 [Notoacmeibacter marinus]|uniref:Selenoprotein n=1 Tax=Notoacmeibacter marinus TaxID=1876515 RepID=A0A231V3J3_9HYPH|nr:SelT/SelW/SelH family protein [Notoacmeibacter marinus]OXT02591.1 hypothetical protein B7H23_06790 [Notoacmeibacter marinus]
MTATPDAPVGQDRGASVEAQAGHGPRIAITYCTRCNWLLRAGWLGSELLSTFATEIGEVALVPDATGGVFTVDVGNRRVWDRAAEERFPEAKELKQRVRDLIDPDRDLGHADR